MTTKEKELKDIFVKLQSQCIRSNSKHNLAVIRDVCIAQVEQGSNDFAVATIARLSAEKKGPKESSIRNKAGDKYRALIAAYKQRYSLKRNGKGNKKSPNDWVDRIEQPDLRWLVKDLLSEVTKLKGEINTLKSITTLNIDLSVPCNESAKAGLTASETQAIEDLLSTERLKSNKWKFDELGRLIDLETNLAISASRLKTALEKSIT